MSRIPYAPGPTPVEYKRAHIAKELRGIHLALPASQIVDARAAYTAGRQDRLILADATGGTFTITLPAAARVKFMEVTVKKIDASANAVTVGATVDGAVNPTLALQYNSMTVVSDGTAWYKTAEI